MFDLKADGVTVRPIAQLGGDTGFGEIFLDDVFVPDEDVIGTAGEGWRAAMSTSSNERGMPENKRRPPGRLSKEVDEYAEGALRYYFGEMIPVAEWDTAERLWHLLKAPDPSTQKRVLAYALDVVVSGQHKLPARLAEAIKAHLIKPTSRNRIKNIEGMSNT